jgi:acyl-CoA thioester hydrolase
LGQHSGAAPKHETRVRVRYAETDQMGVAYYANYFVWMEIGRVELVRSRGCNYKELEQTEGLFLSVIGATCRYLHPATYDQELIIRTEITSSNRRVVEFGYEILSADPPKLLAQGSTRHLWLNREWRPAHLPEKYELLLRAE